MAVQAQLDHEWTQRIPTECPNCGFKTGDAREMVRHWANEGALESSKGRLILRTKRRPRLPEGVKLEDTKAPKGHPGPAPDLGRLLLSKDLEFSWWAGAALLGMVFTLPEARRIVERMFQLLVHILLWGWLSVVLIGTIVVLCSLLFVAVARGGNPVLMAGTIVGIAGTIFVGVTMLAEAGIKGYRRLVGG